MGLGCNKTIQGKGKEVLFILTFALAANHRYR
jgi:hypothetical protein